MLEALGSLGDFVGGVAIIVTLIHLAAQIRQNTTSVRAASRLEIASGWRAHHRQMLDPRVNRAYGKGLRADSTRPLAAACVPARMSPAATYVPLGRRLRYSRSVFCVFFPPIASTRKRRALPPV